MIDCAKKNVAVILQIIILVIGLVAISATLRADVGHLHEAVEAGVVKDAEHDACITSIEKELGNISGKLDIIIQEVYSDG